MRLRASIGIVLFAFFVQSPVFSQTGEPASPESRLAALETLIERSSAARQIESSAVPEALERRGRAREALARAREALRSGDASAAEQRLAEARRLMIEGARLAAPEKLNADKANTEFDARLESTRALLAAQRRVSAEKGSLARGEEATRSIEQRLDAALRLRSEGRLQPAREQLDQAYLIAKASLGAMRGGDTLVRSLHFATKEEEYRYELDRNDTHEMLLRVLLQGRAQAAPARARELRAQAEARARQGDHAAAIRLLEDSTAELVKAIRGAGVYIPG